MTSEQLIARAMLITTGEAYNAARKSHGESKALRWAWVRAKAACAALEAQNG